MQQRPLLALLAVVLTTGSAAAADPPVPPASTAPPAAAPTPATPPAATAPAATPPAASPPSTTPTQTGSAGATGSETDTAPAEDTPASTEPAPTEPEAAEATEPAPSEQPATEPTPAAEPPPAEPAPAVVAAGAEEPPPKGPSNAGIFAQGRVRVGGTIGFSTTVGGGASRSWFILGVGAGVYVLDGLEPHADTTFWIGDPFLATVTPGVRYVFWMVPVVKPYLGTFYRHYFVDGPLGDSDSLGGRVGVNFMLSPNSFVAGGVIYEHFLDEALFENPDQVYPEIMIAVAF